MSNFWLEFPFLPCPAQIGLLAGTKGTSSPAAADQSQVSKAELLNKWQYRESSFNCFFKQT